jgi:hypothetical protein
MGPARSARRVELAEIVRAHAGAVRPAQRLTRGQHRALRAIAACRTAALGGHTEACDTCGATRISYNSCRNRHCPKGQTLAKERWPRARRAELLPIAYFHVVFTLPHALTALAQGNPRVLYALLFAAATQTLAAFGDDPRHLGGELGVVALLHTGGQTLVHHPHVHCLVSGGGLDHVGAWRPVRAGFLLPVRVVRKLFCGKVLGAGEALGATGQLALPPSVPADGLSRLLRAAARRKWNLRMAERYPPGRGVVKYLARYVRGGPIKDSRFVAFDGHHVTFRYADHRQVDARGRPCQQELTLTVPDFLHRWSVHGPLPGVHTVRAWGLYAATQRARLARCRDHLPDPPPDTGPEVNQARPHPHQPRNTCPVGHRPLVLILVVPRGGAPPHPEALSLAASRPPQIPIAALRLHVQLADEAGNGPSAPAHAPPLGLPVAA